MGQILCNLVPSIVGKRPVHVTELNNFQQCVCVCVFLNPLHLTLTFFLSFFPIRIKWPGQRGDCNSYRDWSHRRFLLGLAHSHLLQCEAGQRAPLITVSEFVSVCVSRGADRLWRRHFDPWLLFCLSLSTICLLEISLSFTSRDS